MMLETDRLILTTWEKRDWIPFRRLSTDPEVMRFITGGVPWSDERTQSFVAQQITTFEESGYCRWKLVLISTNEVIGFCGAGHHAGVAEPEIGWWLARDYWGAGLATEAARAALRDAFERVRMPRIISMARPENRASTRIMEKIGLRYLRSGVRDGVDLVFYGLEIDEYRKLPTESNV